MMLLFPKQQVNILIQCLKLKKKRTLKMKSNIFQNYLISIRLLFIYMKIIIFLINKKLMYIAIIKNYEIFLNNMKKHLNNFF